MVLNFVKLTLFCNLFDLKAGYVYQSPYLKTQNLEQFTLLCGENHTIYVKHHHISNVNRTPNLTTDCNEQGIGSGGITLPSNNQITYYSSPFAKTVNRCNEKRECSLQRDYFENTEETLHGFSITDHRGSLCHSIEYECIPDSEVVKNCSHEVATEYKHFYLRLNGVMGNFSCQIVGRILGIEILQTHLARMRISSNGILLYEHQKNSIGVYGQSFTLLTNQLDIEVQDAEVYTYILLRVRSGTSESHVQIGYFNHDLSTEKVKKEDFRDKSCPSLLILVSSVITILVSLLMILSIIQQQRLLKRKTAGIHVKAADKTFLLRSCSTLGGDLKIEIHKGKCICDQLGNLEPEVQSLYENSVLYFTETEANSTKDKLGSSSGKDDPPREEELYIDMLPRVKNSSLYENGT